MNNKYLSIRYKQILIIMAVSVAVLGLSTSLFFLYEINKEEKSVSTELDNRAILIAENVSSTLLFEDAASATRTLQTLKVDPSVLAAILFNEEGEIFASYNKENNTAQLENYTLKPEGIYLEEDFVEVYRPVSLQGSNVGTVFIHSDLVGFEERIFTYSYIVITIFLISLVLTVLLSHHLQKIITEPIERLAQFMGQLSRNKDYSLRLNIESRDEIGILVKEFNEMLTTVEKHKEQLESQAKLVQIRNDQLHQLAYFDDLTGLPNRSMLFEEIEKEISRCNRSDRSFALMFLDLDRFKTINDSLGHAVGDELLQTAAKRLADSVREEDFVARLGGDEFVVMLVNVTSKLNVTAVAESILLTFSYPFNLILNNTSLHVTTSIGVSIYPDDGRDVAILMRNADTSMYHTKAITSGKYMFYEEKMNVANQRLLLIENELRGAIKNNEFNLVYQPQVRLIDSKVTGIEALLRWTNTKLGAVPPSEFIPLAEEIGLIGDIGEWVVERACKQHKEWKDQNYPPLKISVNVSASQLVTINLVEHIKNTLNNYKISSHDFEIEITEAVFLDKSDRNVAQLIKLKEMSIKIAIDDFGTGYSSLGYLQHFPCNILKLDGSFVQTIGQNKKSEDLIAATIILAHSLGLEMIAECVETQAQLDFLEKANCDTAQGYLYGKPLPAAEVHSFIKEHTAASEDTVPLNKKYMNFFV